MLAIRIILAAVLCALLGLLAFYLDDGLDPAAHRARALLGERWYTLTLNGERLGYWRTASRRDPRGRWVFESIQRSALNPDSPLTVSNRRVFGARPPYPLLEAEYQQSRRGYTQGVLIARTTGGYEGRLLQADSPASPVPQQLDWQYTLRDYLDFEVWLRESEPPVGSTRTIRTLDFERLDVISRQLTIVGRNAEGYQIENPAPHAGTRIQLDADYAPSQIRLAGLFDLVRTSRADALAPRGALQVASYYVPLDRPLADHTRLKRLEVGVVSNVPANRLWRGSRRQDGEWRLTLRADPVSTGGDAPSTGAALGVPSTDPRIRQLAVTALGDATAPEARLAALVDYVHGYLTYEAGARTQPVLALLDNPVGDCTEFADLFTALARSVDIPARTVFGLAYSDENGPAFAFHAWNEVRLDDAWRPVDPTWNQLRVDATHLPLPVSEEASLLLLTGVADVRFSLRDAEYFD